MAPRCRYSQELSETSSLVNTLHVCLHVCDPAVLIQFTYPHVCFDSVHVCDPSVLIQFTYAIRMFDTAVFTSHVSATAVFTSARLSARLRRAFTAKYVNSVYYICKSRSLIG